MRLRSEDMSYLGIRFPLGTPVVLLAKVYSKSSLLPLVQLM